MDVLVRIKRAVLAGRCQFTDKARVEMRADSVTEEDVVESIMNAVAIYKRVRSTSHYRQAPREYLYIIEAPNLSGMAIYSKGKLVSEGGVDTYYVLVSAKRAM